MFSATVAGSATVGVILVGVAGVSPVPALSAGAESLCSVLGVCPPPLPRPLEPRPPPRRGLDCVEVVDIVQDGKSRQG